eukprot:893458-Alexandrium_andersonii.AAC.1
MSLYQANERDLWPVADHPHLSFPATCQSLTFGRRGWPIPEGRTPAGRLTLNQICLTTAKRPPEGLNDSTNFQRVPAVSSCFEQCDPAESALKVCLK